MKITQIQFSNRGEPIQPEMLERLEIYIGGELDPEYKHFLLTVNGGVCDPPLWSSFLNYPIQIFFSLTPDGSGLERLFDDINEFRESESLLPIASNTGEEFICFEVGAQESRLVAVDHGEERVIADDLATFEISLTQPKETLPTLASVAKKEW